MVSLAVCALSSCEPSEKPSKEWLHRANNIAKAQYYQNKYPGLEVDVHFVDTLNTFVVQHDFGLHSKLLLEDWFAALERRSELGFWIDFKNLNKGNKVAAAQELARLRKKFNLKKMIIVESKYASYLKEFEKLNFRTSMYIPYFDPRYDNHEKLQLKADTIRDSIRICGVKTISGYWSQYQFMKDSFPEVRKLIWYERQKDTATRNYYIRLANEDELTDVILTAVIDMK